MDKNKAVIDYLLTCEPIRDSALYFNFANAKNGTKLFVTLTQDKNIEKPFINGSISKRYSLTVISYLTISDNPLVKVSGFDDENISDMAEVQALIDWIAEQNSIKNFPDFGENCIVEDINTTAGNPRLDQIDTTISPPLARYSFTIQINYTDNTNIIWN